MKVWGSAATVEAAQTGDIYGVAKAMRDRHYYTGFDCTRDSAHPWGIVLCAPNGSGVAGCAPATEENIECAISQYAQMIKNGVAEVSKALGQPDDDTFVDEPRGTLAGTVVPVVAGAAIVGAAYYFILGKGYDDYTRKVVTL
jgi:hypothetical protein